MSLRSGIWFRKIFDKGVNGKNRELLTFSFFLVLSFVLWYLNSLEKDIEYEMKYPVRYVNLPENRVLANESATRLNVYLKGPGYSILKIKLAGSRTPVALDVSSVSYRRVPGSKNLDYYLLTSSLIPRLRNFLDTECDVTSIKPDTLFFTLDRIISKKVLIRPDIEVQPAKQYLVNGKMGVVPDTVTITGPKRIVDTVRVINTRHRKLKNVNKPATVSIGLDAPDGLTLSEKKVTVTIPLEQFTEAEFRVPVRVLNIPDSLNVRIFPDVVNVRCRVTVTDYKKIRELPFDAVIDFSKGGISSTDKLQVSLLNVPPFISSLRISPSKVDFLVEKRK